MERFENLDPEVFGQTIQFATDANADSSRSLGLGTFAGGSTNLSVIEINNLGTGMPVSLSSTLTIVDAYEEAPGGRQLNDLFRLNNISPDITGNVVEHDGYLWTSHSVQGTDGNAAVRWYQIDTATLDVVDSGLIENTDLDFLYPSIDVSPQNIIAIGFTGTGLLQPASSYLTMGFYTEGLTEGAVTFPSLPEVVTQGTGNFDNPIGSLNRWGEYSATHFDPDNPFSVYTFQQYSSGSDTWSTSIAEAGITDIQPLITADDNSNEVVVRRSELDSNLVEVEIDGMVTDTFEFAALNLMSFTLGDGDDTVTYDLSLLSDQFSFSILADGGLGSDTLQFDGDSPGISFEIVSNISSEVGEFSSFENLNGTNGDDTFTITSGNFAATVNGLAGNDVFDVIDGDPFSTQIIELQLNGGEGDDSYRLPLADLAAIEVIDSVDDEADSLVALGTDFADVLTINNEMLTINGEDAVIEGLFDGIEQIDFDGLDGDDIFNIQAIADDLTVMGGDGNDTFNVSSDSPLLDGVTTGIAAALSVDGGTGSNRLQVSNAGGAQINAIVTSDQISGMTFEPITYTGDFGTAADGTPGIILTGSNLASDLFDIRQMLAGNSILAIGGGGNDIFNVRANTIGDVYLDGGANGDTYRTSFATDSDHTVKIIESGEDDERDRFSVRVTNEDDTFNIGSQSLNAQRNFLSWNENLENLVIDTLGGNDVATIRSNIVPFVRVSLGDGNDTGIVEGTLGISTVKFQGLAGNDNFDFQNSVAATFVQALGGEGNDSFIVGATSFARSRVDGEAGNDSTNVFFAARDNRRVNARDTGDGGTDTLLVTGTMAADRIDLRNKLISRDGEFISYDENTEDFDMELIGSNDVLNIFGTSVLQFDANLGVGNDTVNVFATSTPNATVAFDVSLSSGNDTANIFRVAENARVGIFGQSGNDVFNVGSNSTDNTGNLSRIRGELFVQGGSDTPGVDTLHVNDFAAVASFSYLITDSSFRHDTTSLDRPFEGFNHGGMEFVFAYGTDRANHFTVTPSLTTVIRVDGNLGDDSLRILSAEERNFFGDASEGFIAFEGGSKNVSYIELEDLSGAEA